MALDPAPGLVSGLPMPRNCALKTSGCPPMMMIGLDDGARAGADGSAQAASVPAAANTMA